MHVRAACAARAARAEKARRGIAPAGPFCAMGRRPPYPASSEVAPFRLAVITAAMRRARRRAAEGAPLRPFSSQRGQIDSMVPAAQRRRRARSGILPPCGPFLRYEVERCLPDASLVLSEVVLIQNEFAVSAVGYVGGFGCYLIVYET